MRFRIMQISDLYHVWLGGISPLSPFCQICSTANTVSISLTTPLMVCYDRSSPVKESYIQWNV